MGLEIAKYYKLQARAVLKTWPRLNWSLIAQRTSTDWLENFNISCDQ